MVRHLRAHRVPALALVMATMASLDLILGSLTLVFPGAGRHVVLTIGQLLPAAYAAVTVSSLTSVLEPLQRGAGRNLAGVRALQVLALSTTAALLLLLAHLGAGPEPGTWQSVGMIGSWRALVIWTGIGLMAGRLLGWSRAWAVPVTPLLPLTYLGTGQWWDWLHQSDASLSAWLLAAAALAAATVALALDDRPGVRGHIVVR
jgi:hypothetical protein